MNEIIQNRKPIIIKAVEKSKRIFLIVSEVPPIVPDASKKSKFKFPGLPKISTGISFGVAKLVLIVSKKTPKELA
jgi:hypothetical protein